MPDPLAFDDTFESLFQSEILPYLSLQKDVQHARRVTRRWNTVCSDFKEAWIEALDDTKGGCSVVLLELNSAKGKTLNGSTVKIAGKRIEKTQRYPISLDNWLTGETETLTFKICNLNPFATSRDQTSKTNSNKADHPKLIEYTNNAKLRVSHGMMLDALLMLARWETNVVNGMLFDGDYNTFANLPRGHRVVARLNANMWTYWTVQPKLAGLYSRGTILDCICKAMMDRDPSVLMAKNDTSPSPWPQDGPNGMYMARNMIRFMRTWATERVTSGFWVSHRYPTGSIMTAVGEDGKFGQVYLVKGHASVIAELVPQLPFSCRATLLPLYDSWTYDGVIHPNPNMDASFSARGKKKLEEHVKKAIIEGNVSWRGPSADKWQYPPPEFPEIAFESNGEVGLKWTKHDVECRNSETRVQGLQEQATAEHMALGRKIAAAAKAKGGIDTSPSPQNTWVIRRYGYSYKENPNGIALLMTHGLPITDLHFNVDHSRKNDKDYVPTYNLKEALQFILKGLKSTRLADTVQPDEFSIVASLDKVLKQCFEEKGQTAPSVRWYPPASEEESAFAAMFGDMDDPNQWGANGP